MLQNQAPEDRHGDPYGFNAASEDYGDMIEAGRWCLVADEPEEVKKMPGGMPGEMGGMGGGDIYEDAAQTPSLPLSERGKQYGVPSKGDEPVPLWRGEIKGVSEHR